MLSACGQGTWWAQSAAKYTPGFSLDGSGPGGIRPVCDQGAKREQGANLRDFVGGVCFDQ